MRKFVRMISMLLCFVMLLGMLPAVAWAENASLGDDFEAATIGTAPENWNITSAMNANVTVESVYDMDTTRALRLSDQSSTNLTAASATLQFEQTPTSVSLDLKAESLGYEKGGTRRSFPVIDLLDGSGAWIVRIVVQPVDDRTGVVAYYNESTKKYVPSSTYVPLDTWHTVKVDMVERKVSVDDSVVFDSAAFQSTNDAASLCMMTTGKLYLNDVFYVDNISYTDANATYTQDFESTELGAVPDGYTVTTDTAVTCAVAETTCAAAANTATGNAMRIEDNSNTSNAKAAYSFAKSGSVTYSFDYRAESAYGANCFSVYEGTERHGGLAVFENGDGTLALKYLDKTSDQPWIATDLTNMQRGEWYTFEVKITEGETTAPVYVDDTKVGDMIVTSNGGLDVLEFSCSSANATGDIFWIDNVSITVPEVTAGSAVSQMLSTSGNDNVSNTWMFDGGATTVGSFEDIGGARSYVYHFEEWIRWGNRQNTSNEATQRFVFNVAKDGQTLSQSLNSFDSRATALNPRAAVYLVGAEDCGGGDAGIDAFKTNLTAYITKALALRSGSGFAVIQTPHPSVTNAADYAAAVQAVVDGLDDAKKARVLVVNHTSAEWDADDLNSDGSLSALGHLEMARQLCGPIWGKALTDFPTETMKENFPNLKVKDVPAAYSADAPTVTAGTNSLSVVLPNDVGDGTWVCMLETGDYTLTTEKSGTMFTITDLPNGADYTLTITAKDWSVQLPVMSGTVTENDVATVKTVAAGNTALTNMVKDEEPRTWLFVGDSITHGAYHAGGYDTVTQLFEKYLRDDLGRTDDLVINTAVSGATAASTVTNLEARLNAYDPDVVIMMLGTNDGRTLSADNSETFNTALNAFEAKLGDLVQAAKDKGATVVLRTTVPTQYDNNIGVTQCAERTRAVATSKSLLLVDQYHKWSELIKAEPYYSDVLYNDNLHPNAIGHTLMFRQLVEVLGLPLGNKQLTTLEYDYTAYESDDTELEITQSGSTYTLDTAALATAYGKDMSSVTLIATAQNGDTYAVTGDTDADLTLQNVPTGTYTMTVTAQLKDEAKVVTFTKTSDDSDDDPADDPAQNPVEPLVAFYTEDAVALDGNAQEAWYFSGDFDGTPDGVLAAMWDKDSLYLAVKSQDGESITVKINDKEVTRALTAGVTELSIPLSEFDLEAKPADQIVEFAATLKAEENATELPATKLELRFNTAAVIPNVDSLADWVDGQPYGEDDNTSFVAENDGMHVSVKEASKQGILAKRFTATVPELPLDIDMTVDVNDLPVITKESVIAWRGLVVDVHCGSGTRSRYALTKDGTDGSILLSYLYGPNDKTGVSKTFDTGLPVDSTFKLRFCAAADSSTKVYINGVHVHTFEAGTNYVATNMTNLVEIYASYFDCDTSKGIIDATVKDLAVSTLATFEGLSFDDIKGQNSEADFVSYDLQLMDKISWGGTNYPVTWESSDTAALGHDGKVTTPSETGSPVTLTATIDMDGTKKTVTFALKVYPGSDYSLYYKENDLNPYTGALNMTNIARNYTLDQTYNSIGYDLGSEQTVNRVILTDNDGIHRIHEIDLAIYVSDNNVTYTKVKDFTMSAAGNQLYLYNFTAEGRYVKVHCTYDGSESADFTGPLRGMIWAGNESELPGAGNGTFRKLDTASVAVQYGGDDVAAYIPYADLTQALEACKDDKSDLRFVLGSTILPYWLDDEGAYLRIPSASANSTVTVEVWGGNEAAVSLSDIDAVFEVTYGNRTIQDTTKGEFIDNTIVRRMPNGDLLAVANDAPKNPCAMWYRRSTDGGRTWGEPQKLTTIGASHRNEAGGWIEDGDRVWLLYYRYKDFVGSNMNASDNKLAVVYTDDSGYTWSEPYVIDTGHTYNVTYANGIKLSDADGKGPKVDFVWPYAFQAGNNSTFQVSAAYSRDGGETWTSSESCIDYSLAASGHEGGLSEPTITELSDGTLKLFMRCQYGSSYALATSTSNDHGVTWDQLAVASNVASSNTAPTLSKHDVDGDGKEEDVLVWSGNNLLGGTARARGPLNIAWSDDDTANWNQKLNLFHGTSLCAVPAEQARPVTQPDLTKARYMGSDDAVISWWHNNLSSSRVMLLEDYTDMLYKTKGAADDFEASSAKYEGWLAASGSVVISADKAADGARSLYLDDDGGIVRADRTIPAMRSGEVSFDVSFKTLSSTFFIELKSAYSNKHGSGSVIMAAISSDGTVIDRNTAVTPGEGDSNLGKATLSDWNRVTVKYDLPAKTAEIYVNGVKVGNLTVNTGNGDSITNIQLSDGSSKAGQLLEAYVDNFYAFGNGFGKVNEDTINAELEATGYDTGVLKNVDNTMQYSVDGGQTWYDITGNNMTIADIDPEKDVLVKTSGGQNQTIDVTRATTPTAKFEATCDGNGTLTDVDDTMQYSLDGGQTWHAISGTKVDFTDVDPEKDMQVKALGSTDTELDSKEQTIDIQLQDHQYGSLIAEQEVVHTKTELEPAVAAHYFCDICDTYFTAEKEETTLAALTGETPKHSYGNWITNDDTKHWKECSCGLKSEEGDHSYGNDQDAECDTCGHSRIVHNCGGAEHVAAKPATCNEKGNIEYWICECGKWYKDKEAKTEITDKTSVVTDIDSDAHQWNAGVITTKPTCTEAGVKTFTCEHDAKHTYTETVKALGHTDVLDPKGICDVCEEYLQKVEINPNYTDAQIPEELKQAGFETVAEIAAELKVSIEKQEVKSDKAVLYDVILMYMDKDGKWQKADETHFPESGKLSVTLPVPAGTGPKTHRFHAVHMFTSSAFGKTPGAVETFKNLTAVSDGKGGYTVTIEVTGLSPILVVAEAIDTTPNNPTEPSAPAETTKPTEPSAPAETTKPTETISPTEATKPSETTVPTEPSKPAETTKPSNPAVPDSGDNSNVSLYMVLTVVSLGACMVLIALMKKKRYA